MANHEDEGPADSWEGADEPDQLEQHYPPLSEEEEAERDAQRRAWIEQREDEEFVNRAEEEQAYQEYLLGLADPLWNEIGRRLGDARVKLGLSKREAARRSGLSDGAWRHLEAGVKYVGNAQVFPNPKDENLIAAARAVEIDPTDLFNLARRPVPKDLIGAPEPERLLEDLRRLSAMDRDLVAGLIRRLRSH